MSTWTMEQVFAVKRLHATLHLDAELVDHYGESVVREAEAAMVRRLGEMAHPLGVELGLEREHYVIEWRRPEDAPWSIVGRMYWSPQTTTVELRGGHLDGQQYSVRKVGESLRVPRSVATPWLGS